VQAERCGRGTRGCLGCCGDGADVRVELGVEGLDGFAGLRLVCCCCFVVSGVSRWRSWIVEGYGS